jgi:hypothetical protein
MSSSREVNVTPNDLISGSCRMAKFLLHRMVDDLTPAEFDHQPVPGANSAAWTVGHLAVTLRRVAERLGATGLPEVPPDLLAKLTTTKQAAGDQSGLGDPAVLVRLFDTCSDKLFEAVGAVPAEALAGPSSLPIAFAGNHAEALLLVGGLHTAMHTGQLSTIRRSLGKPPVV